MAECPKHGRTYLLNGECLAGEGPEVSDLCGWMVPATDDMGRGLYKKYHVQRLGDVQGKHTDCEYFVLDLSHDPFSVPALRAYADACERLYPKLAADLRKKFGASSDGDDLAQLADEVARLRHWVGEMRRQKERLTILFYVLVRDHIPAKPLVDTLMLWVNEWAAKQGDPEPNIWAWAKDFVDRVLGISGEGVAP
jgi:hypothetical protein